MARHPDRTPASQVLTGQLVADGLVARVVDQVSPADPRMPSSVEVSLELAHHVRDAVVAINLPGIAPLRRAADVDRAFGHAIAALTLPLNPLRCHRLSLRSGFSGSVSAAIA